MKTEIVSADRLIQWQHELRINGGMLIRARPFKRDNQDLYFMMFLEV